MRTKKKYKIYSKHFLPLTNIMKTLSVVPGATEAHPAVH